MTYLGRDRPRPSVAIWDEPRQATAPSGVDNFPWNDCPPSAGNFQVACRGCPGVSRPNCCMYVAPMARRRAPLEPLPTWRSRLRDYLSRKTPS